jgi:hypothetical protein
MKVVNLTGFTVLGKLSGYLLSPSNAHISTMCINLTM